MHYKFKENLCSMCFLNSCVNSKRFSIKINTINMLLCLVSHVSEFSILVNGSKLFKQGRTCLCNEARLFYIRDLYLMKSGDLINPQSLSTLPS